MSRLPISNGRRFGCTMCGNCCVEPGYVYMTLAELRAMAAHRNVPVADFKTEYGIQWDAGAGEYFIDAMDGTGCPLLTKDRQCLVHPVKPTQCRTFPFWDEMLDDRHTWESAKSYCPGLDAEGGRNYSKKEIATIRQGQEGT